MTHSAHMIYSILKVALISMCKYLNPNLEYLRSDLHLRAGFGQSCAVKYSFGVNITLF